MNIKVDFKVELEQSDEYLIFDRITFEWLTSEPYLTKIDFINNLKKNDDGEVRYSSSDSINFIEISLSTLILKEFFKSPLSSFDNSNLIHKNGNVLDYKLENLDLVIVYEPSKYFQ